MQLALIVRWIRGVLGKLPAMIPASPPRWWPGLSLLLIVALLGLSSGIHLGRRWFPRTVEIRVDPKIVAEAPKPGEPPKKSTVPTPRVKYVPVPYPVPYPKEIPVVIERPGPERIRVITKPVLIPPEVIELWPQVITIRVGSVLTQEYGWATPVYPDLTIGQVTQGVYAISAELPGWKVHSVATETQVPSAPPTPQWHVAVRLGAGVIVGPSVNAGLGGNFDVTKGPLAINATVLPWGVFGPSATVFIGYRFFGF